MALDAAILPAALALDAMIGDPPALWRRLPHPVVLFGKLIGALDRRLNRGHGRRAKGVAALALLLGLAWAVGAAIAALPFGPALEILVGAVLLAQRSLVDHVRAVADGLGHSLAAGRRQVAMIVGRDTETLDEAGVARAAIESAAENFSDGVVAPAFWFAVLGLPGLLAYKALNTADSMIGYRTERHREFGWAAARADDVANWLPARLAALLLALGGGAPGALRIAWRDAGLHRSPNAGWPEAAAAGALGVALSGPRVYDGALTDDPFVHPEGRRDLGAAEIRSAIALLWRGWALLFLLALTVAALRLGGL